MYISGCSLKMGICNSFSWYSLLCREIDRLSLFEIPEPGFTGATALFLVDSWSKKSKTSFGSKTVKVQALLVYGNIKNQFRNVAYTNSISRIWQAKRALAGAWGKASFMCTLNNNSSIIRFSHFRALLYFESIVETSRRLRPRRF